MADRVLPKAGLCKATGFSMTQVNRFLKRGLPHDSVPRPKNKKGVAAGGRPATVYNLAECLAWFGAKGIITPNQKAASDAGLAAKNPAPAPVVPTPETTEEKVEQMKPVTSPNAIDFEMMKQSGIIGALERMRFKELRTAQAAIRKLTENGDPMEIAALQRTHSKELQTLRQLEFAVINYRKQIGELVEFEGMVNAWERIAVSFRNAVLGIPNVAAQKIRPYLHSPDDMLPIIVAMLDELCRESLRSIPDETPTRSDSKNDSSSSAFSASVNS